MPGGLLVVVLGMSCGAGDAVMSVAPGGDAWPSLEAGGVPVPASDDSSSAGDDLGAADHLEVEEADTSDAFDSGHGQVAADAGSLAISLTLCLRLDDPQRPAHTSTLSLDVEQTYVRLAYLDCDVAKMVVSDEDTLSSFQNELVSWNLSFWGCRAEGTTRFGILRDGFGGVTSADAARLVNHYVTAAGQVLLLSPGEELAMRQALAELSVPVITRAADEFSLSTCKASDGATWGDEWADGSSLSDEADVSDGPNPPTETSVTEHDGIADAGAATDTGGDEPSDSLTTASKRAGGSP